MPDQMFRIESDLLGALKVPAEAYYGVPASLQGECRRRLPEDMLAVLRRFDEVRKPRADRDLADA